MIGPWMLAASHCPALAFLLLAFTFDVVRAAGHCDEQFGFEVNSWTGFWLANQTTLITNSQWARIGSSSLYQSVAAFQVPTGCGEGLQLSAWASFQPSTLQDDPQDGYGLLGLASPDEGWNFAFWLTGSRVYALYARLPNGQSPTNYYTAAAFLIPVALRQAESQDFYEIWLDPGKLQVSYRMNRYDLLVIKEPGRMQQVDPKFQIGDFGGFHDDPEGFPTTVVTQIGLGLAGPPLFTGFPHTACQGGIFDHCCDSLCSAGNVDCQYAPYDPNRRTGNQVVYEDLAVSRLIRVGTCPQWTCQFNVGQADCPNQPGPDFCAGAGAGGKPGRQCLPRVPESPNNQPFLPWLRRRVPDN